MHVDLNLHRALDRAARAGVAVFAFARTYVLLRGGVSRGSARAGLWLAAVATLSGVALFLWSTLPASAQTGPPVVWSIRHTDNNPNHTIVITFDRSLTAVPSMPHENDFILPIQVNTHTSNAWSLAGGSVLSGSVLTVRYVLSSQHANRYNIRTGLSFAFNQPGASDPNLQDSNGNNLAGFTLPVPYTNPAAPKPRSTAPSPDPSNLARSAVQWEPVGGMHPVSARIGEISSNKPSGASGSLDLSAIAASISEDLRRHSRGFYLTVLVESTSGNRHLLRRLNYELARGAPLLKVSIWHVYRHVGRGTNTVELLGDVFGGRPADRLAEPVEICLPAPPEDAERARIAVRGRTDSDWTILDTRLTEDGQLCAETTRVSWFTIVLEAEPESEEAAA